ncbi:MAG: sensor histidine kinase [Actinomycetota bacterium]
MGLLLTVMAALLSLTAYFPFRQATGQVEAAQRDIESSLAAESVGRGVTEWLWRVGNLVVSGPDVERNHVAVSHLKSMQALKSLRASERDATARAQVEAIESAMAVVDGVVQQITAAVKQGDQTTAIKIFVGPAYLQAAERVSLPLDALIQQENNQMREAFVRLAGDAAASGPFANAYLGRHVLKARSESEESLYASKFARSRALHGQVLAAAMTGSPVFDPEVLEVMRLFAANELQNWRNSVAEDAPGGTVTVPQDLESIVVADAKLNASSLAIERLVAKGDVAAARGLFSQEFESVLNSQIIQTEQTIRDQEKVVFAMTTQVVRDARVIFSVVALFAAVILGLAFASARAARRTARRITDATKGVRGISRDDRDTRLAEEGDDELTLLARAFNERLDDLADARRAEREFLRRTVEAAESERMKLAADLHDGPIQRLTALLYRLELVESLMGRGDTDGVTGLIGEAQKKISEEVGDLRQMLSELRPPALDQRGLASALEDYVSDFSRRAGLACDLDIRFEGRVAESLETTMYRVAQEALANVDRHAHASRVNLALWSENGSTCLVVSDDGVGFETDVLRNGSGGSHFGLTAMRERVRMAGGECDVASAPGSGTVVRAKFPNPLKEAV